MAKINIDKMLVEIERQNMEWFHALSQDIQKEAIEETAKETVRTLKAISPKGARKKKKYANTWTYDKNNHFSGAYRFATTVYNKDNYRLTHLLEHGHAITTKKGGRKGGGDTTPQEHIATAEKQAEQILVDKVLDIISKSI